MFSENKTYYKLFKLLQAWVTFRYFQQHRGNPPPSLSSVSFISLPSSLLLLSQDGARDEIQTFRGSLIPDRIVATTGGSSKHPLDIRVVHPSSHDVTTFPSILPPPILPYPWRPTAFHNISLERTSKVTSAYLLLPSLLARMYQ